jgi:hypothetical protein
MIDSSRLQELKELNRGFMHYEPQPVQRQVHDSLKSIIIISGGEGSGKSFVTSGEIASRYGTWKKVLLVCYKSKSARNEADYLYHFLSEIGAVADYKTPEEGTIRLTTRDGATVESVSTYAEGERAVSGTGQTYDIIAMLEAGKQRYSVFQSCLIRIQRSGGLLILSGTIEKSEPWFADVLTRLQGENELGAEVVIMPTWENRFDYPGGRDDPKIKKLESELTPDLFMERLGGKPAPLHSLVFKEFSFLTHVFDWVQYDPTQTVEAWIDYGYSGSHYSILFVQFHPRAYTRQFRSELPDVPLTDVFVIGDLYLDHATHEDAIIECKKLTWWNHVTEGVGDVVGKTHPQAGQSPFDVWRDKAGLPLRGQYILVPDNVDRQHTFLKDPSTSQPREFFNPSCQGLREYSRWKRKEIGENLYGDPETANCDFIKANGYGLIDHFGRVDRHLQPQAISIGVRPNVEESTHQLPQMTGMPSPVSPRPVGAPVNRNYVVVPRKPRQVVGGANQPPPDRII